MFRRTRCSHCSMEKDLVSNRKRWILIPLTWRGSAGLKAIKVSATEKEKIERRDNILTLPSVRVNSSTRCEVNMIKK